MNEESGFRYRSLFWPILLIGVGLLWLLANLNVLPRGGWMVLVRFWPLLLIAIGLDLIIGRRAPILGAIIGLGTVGLAIALLLVGPSLNLVTLPEVTTDSYSEPLGSASSARIDVDLSIGPSTIRALSTSRNLFEAEITHLGTIDFSVQGDTEKNIRIREREVNLQFDWFDALDDIDLRWDIGLAQDIPLFIDLNGGVGPATVDLSELDLTGVDLNSGVGEMTLTLPATGVMYPVDIKVGVGRCDIRLEEGIDAEIRIEGGVGETRVFVPSGVGVRIEGEIDIGNITVPSSYNQVRYDGDPGIGESGVWESPGYASADHKVTITFKGGVGDFTVR